MKSWSQNSIISYNKPVALPQVCLIPVCEFSINVKKFLPCRNKLLNFVEESSCCSKHNFRLLLLILPDSVNIIYIIYKKSYFIIKTHSVHLEV